MTTKINIDDFRPWVKHITPSKQQWFGLALSHIISNGFELYETSSTDINMGRLISFSNGDCHIDVTRQMQTFEYGVQPGIRLMNEIKAYEISLSANAPTDVVRLAIAQLHNEDI